ncbi:MAG: hypothetical protein M1834_000356 [Cirrosporium novae-zelandiae]|nr:MAG: hypothetical protein M1834_000356 [Cirrosporium novae-zelandiae]
MTTIDFNKLKARTLDSTADEEAVTVNTRALIDKVLARYSGEWTVLRELLQNAADAGASKVTVKFESIPSPSVPVPQSTDPSAQLKHTITYHTIKRLVISNNGHPFGHDDWSRLKRIAEGNPDETKIGAFGVGFYSVFADCEEPFVSSGREALAFYWKGNSLFTRRLVLSEEDNNPNTNFVLDYRNTTSPIPGLLPLCQFLASSLTFVALEEIELWLDDWKLLSLSKKEAPSTQVSIPRGLHTTTAEGMMKVTAVHRAIAQLDASWMNAVDWKSETPNPSADSGNASNAGQSLRSFFSRLTANSSHSLGDRSRKDQNSSPKPIENLTDLSTAIAFLYTTTASLQTSVTSSFKQELERATKKPPPKTTKVAILTSSFEENEPSSTKKSPVIFTKVLPSKSGRIFIGFPTQQTTGIKAHISIPSLIPTVERESIDLNARWVRTWNVELLRAVGITCRVAWSIEMSNIQSKLSHQLQNEGRRKLDEKDIEGVIPEALNILNHFNFEESTPLPQISQKIEETFWLCGASESIDLLSSNGVLPSNEIRVASEKLSFVDGVPLLPEKLREGARDFINKLIDFGVITEISVSDIKKALEARLLTAEQLEEFIKWIGPKAYKNELDKFSVQSLLSVTVAEGIPRSKLPPQPLMVSQIECFINANKIPPELPVPPNTMPFAFTKFLQEKHYKALGWQELQVVPWIRWLLENSSNRNALDAEQDVTDNPIFAKQVLPVLSKQFDGLSPSSKSSIIEALSTRTVIPTKLGMRKPFEAYFSSVKLFDDLPTVSGLNGVKDKFLVTLGVRKTVELGVIFERLLASPTGSGEKSGASEGKWSHVDLIKYLASVRDDIPNSDIERLKKTPICPAENGNQNPQANKLYSVQELFAPTDSLRDLGLPILQWPDVYNPRSVEGKFLTFLGLRNQPTVPELVSIINKASVEGRSTERDHVLAYFLFNHLQNGYASFDMSGINTPFLPIEGSDKELSTPSQVFTNNGVTLLGFNILKRTLHPHAQKLGIRANPPIEECILRLIRDPPKTKQIAREVFGYFSGRLAEIHAIHIERLTRAAIVPIFDGKSEGKMSTPRFVAPAECFLGESEVFGEIFEFVNFGSEGNSFLLKCGSKHEPSTIEIARLMVREPARVYSTCKSTDRYLDLLRRIAEILADIKKQKDLFRAMQSSRFLLASREVPATAEVVSKSQANTTDDDDDDDENLAPILEWQLASANEIIIADDYVGFQLFKEKLLAAPQEGAFETFYASLGTPSLNSLVEETAHVGTPTGDQTVSMRLQKRVLERSRLFLHGISPDMIKHNAKWLEGHLSLKAVREISYRRTLKKYGLVHKEQRTAVITRNPTRTGWVLSITSSPDLYQVSQAVVHILMKKPTEHSALTLESLLTTDLKILSARGYNVTRILRRREAENRIAEENRRAHLEEERKQLAEQERQWNESQAQRQSVRETKLQETEAMPGNFPDSPPRMTGGPRGSSDTILPAEQEPRRNIRGLFQNITKRLGLDDSQPQSDQMRSLLGGPSGVDSPPPYTANDPNTSQNNALGIHNVEQPVTAPHQLRQNLISAIQKSRPHGSSNLYTPGETNTVQETSSYCDERNAHDLSFLASSSSGLKIFVEKSIGQDGRSTFLSGQASGINSFGNILLECADIFALKRDSLHIFYDLKGPAIAFNSSGSIFCNYRFFEQLHLQKVQQGDKAQATVYWFVTLCHELAHNIVADHSSSHSFYTFVPPRHCIFYLNIE